MPATVSRVIFGLLLTRNHLPVRAVHFNLRAHLLDLRGLLFDGCSETRNFPFHLSDNGSLLFHRAVLFEKLVKQHRVHLVVADAVRLSVLVAHYQVRIHFVDFFGDESELRYPCWINFLFVMERDRLKREERLTGRADRLDVFLKPL
jgi:hypothetical protein